MAKAPVKFNRVAAAFDEVARARFCESSGSDHSPENSPTDLSDLVNSFIENDERDEGQREEKIKREMERNDLDSDSFWSGSETRDMLVGLFGCQENDGVKRNIIEETELACQVIGNSSSHGFKRRLMTRLRERGFDAGLCKSRWEKKGSIPSGDYEYIDINLSGTRYVVELFLRGQFEIARPTSHYTSLLDVFPQLLVGKLEELKQIVRIMCRASKESMKSMELNVPPWRRNGYMQAKWFGSYKRTINTVPAGKVLENDEEQHRLIGFEATRTVSYYCRGDYGSKNDGLRVGRLAAALNG